MYEILKKIKEKIKIKKHFKEFDINDSNIQLILKYSGLLCFCFYF